MLANHGQGLATKGGHPEMHGAHDASAALGLLEVCRTEVDLEAFAVDRDRLHITEVYAGGNRVVLVAGIAFEVAQVDGLRVFDVVPADRMVGEDHVYFRAVRGAEVAQPKDAAAVIELVDRGCPARGVGAARECAGRQCGGGGARGERRSGGGQHREGQGETSDVVHDECFLIDVPCAAVRISLSLCSSDFVTGG